MNKIYNVKNVIYTYMHARIYIYIYIHIYIYMCVYLLDVYIATYTRRLYKRFTS